MAVQLHQLSRTLPSLKFFSITRYAAISAFSGRHVGPDDLKIDYPQCAGFALEYRLSLAFGAEFREFQVTTSSGNPHTLPRFRIFKIRFLELTVHDSEIFDRQSHSRFH